MWHEPWRADLLAGPRGRERLASARCARSRPTPPDVQILVVGLAGSAAPPISRRRGVEIADATHVGEWLQAAGLAQVQTHLVPIPCGDYGGRIGKMMATDYFSGVKAVGGVIASQGLTSREVFELTLHQAMEDIASSQYRCVFPVSLAYGQRPLRAKARSS